MFTSGAKGSSRRRRPKRKQHNPMATTPTKPAKEPTAMPAIAPEESVLEEEDAIYEL